MVGHGEFEKKVRFFVQGENYLLTRGGLIGVGTIFAYIGFSMFFYYILYSVFCLYSYLNFQ